MRGKFKESLRKTFFKTALQPTIALLVLWAVCVVAYGQFAVRRSNHAVNGAVLATVAKGWAAYEEMLETAATNEALLAALRGQGTGTAAVEELYSFNNSVELPSIFYLFDAEGNLLVTNTWQPRDTFLADTPFYSEVLSWLAEHPAQQYMRVNRRDWQGGRRTVFTLGGALVSGGEIEGYLLFDWQAQPLAELVSSSDANYIVLTDSFGNTLASNNTGILGTVQKFSLPGQNGRTEIRDTTMYYTVGTQSGCPLVLYTLTSMALQQQLMLFGLGFIAVSTLLLFLVLRNLSNRVAAKNTQHLDELVQAVDEISRGNYGYEMQPGDGGGDEFAYLRDRYGRLIGQIGHLIQINEELAEMKRRSEIKHLQAQFNPHFIFNVLENIKYEVYIDADKAQNTVTLLAQLLRYSISTTGDTVTLGSDMEYIVTYLELQKQRYDERLNYAVSIPPGLESCLLPKLIIQPLAENCITHGYCNKENLSINITGTLENGNVVLRVTDDGDGIPPVRLAGIKERMRQPELQGDNIGLYNSHRRLQLMYGDGYGLEIHSVVGVGTEIVITFPAVWEQGGAPDV